MFVIWTWIVWAHPSSMRTSINDSPISLDIATDGPAITLVTPFYGPLTLSGQHFCPPILEQHDSWYPSHPLWSTFIMAHTPFLDSKRDGQTTLHDNTSCWTSHPIWTWLLMIRPPSLVMILDVPSMSQHLTAHPPSLVMIRDSPQTHVDTTLECE